MPSNRVIVRDNKRLRGINADTPQVQAAIDARTLEIGVTAEALFAPHNHPGGHRIEVDKGDVDGLVSLVGPIPLAVEFGHFQGKRGLPDRKFVKGLHILSRAAGL